MSLKPKDLGVADLKVALRPALGFERQLYVSTQQYANLGAFQMVAPNSGVFTPSQADAAILAGTPAELLAVLQADANLGASDLVLTVSGTDGSNNPLTGTATFTPPSYAQQQDRVFPKSWSAEVTTSPAGGKFKTIANIAVTSDAALAEFPAVQLVGLPSADASATGTFKKIATKVTLNWDPAIPMPTAVQDGRNKGAYIKPGDIEVVTLEINAKELSSADGLSRVMGRRVTGWILEKKEDKIATMHTFFPGLVMTPKVKTAEGQEPTTLDVTAMAELYAMVVAH